MPISRTSLGKIAFDEKVYTASEVDELLSEKQDAIDIDPVPVEGSQNPVSSGGVAQYVEDGLAGLKSELEGYADSNDEATRAEIGSLRAYLSSALRYMGSVPSFDGLPEDADPGDVWSVAADNMDYAWALGSDDSGHWDPLGATLEGYPTRAELEDALDAILSESGDTPALEDGLYARNPATGLFHRITVEANELGQLSLAIDQEGIAARPFDMVSEGQ